MKGDQDSWTSPTYWTKRKTKLSNWKRRSRTSKRDWEEPRPGRSNWRTKSSPWELKASNLETRPSLVTNSTTPFKEKMILIESQNKLKLWEPTSPRLLRSGKISWTGSSRDTPMKEPNSTMRSPAFFKEPTSLRIPSTELRPSKFTARRLSKSQSKIQGPSTWFTCLRPTWKCYQPNIQNFWLKLTPN